MKGKNYFGYYILNAYIKENAKIKMANLSPFPLRPTFKQNNISRISYFPFNSAERNFIFDGKRICFTFNPGIGKVLAAKRKC